mgnify:CR=1 FL=1
MHGVLANVSRQVTERRLLPRIMELTAAVFSSQAQHDATANWPCKGFALGVGVGVGLRGSGE